MKALIWVQHLLGIGHVRRAALIARAMTEAGLDVTVASGGFPVAGVSYGDARVVQLPPARAADKSFKLLVTEGDRPLDDAWKERRRTALLSLADESRSRHPAAGNLPLRPPSVPFRTPAPAGPPDPPASVAASVRDILVAKDNPAREAEMADIARRHLDLVLVHGDPALVPFEATFPPADTIRDLIRYTGYVAPARNPPTPDGDGHGEVVVSVGGGAVGLPLLRAAMEARPLTALANIPWRLLAGPDIPEAEFQTLRTSAPAGIIVERARPDFPELLARCTLSISQAGYNTLMDILQARCRAVVVPFAAGNETEQTDRARLFEARGLLHIADEAGLTAETLRHRHRPRARSAAAARLHPRTGRSGQYRPPADRGRVMNDSAAWEALTRELDLWAAEGRTATFWWRDDDATAPTPALSTLRACATAAGIPVALAVIPARATTELAAELRDWPSAAVLQHGLSHTNHETPPAKKTELGPARPASARDRGSHNGLEPAGAFRPPARPCPALEPDFTRPDRPPPRPRLQGLSTFTPRAQPHPAPGLLQVNTHVDIIDWRGGGIFAGTGAAISRHRAPPLGPAERRRRPG